MRAFCWIKKLQHPTRIAVCTTVISKVSNGISDRGPAYPLNTSFSRLTFTKPARNLRLCAATAQLVGRGKAVALRADDMDDVTVVLDDQCISLLVDAVDGNVVGETDSTDAFLAIVDVGCTECDVIVEWSVIVAGTVPDGAESVVACSAADSCSLMDRSMDGEGDGEGSGAGGV